MLAAWIWKIVQNRAEDICTRCHVVGVGSGFRLGFSFSLAGTNFGKEKLSQRREYKVSLGIRPDAKKNAWLGLFKLPNSGLLTLKQLQTH